MTSQQRDTPPRAWLAAVLTGGSQPRWRRLRRAGLWLLGLVLVVPPAAFAVGWLTVPVPSSDDLATTQVAMMYYADGRRLATVQPDGVKNRVKIGLDRVPLPVRRAVLAAEDRTFYSNPGFDVTAIVRAVTSQLTGGDGGGSTITQQYIKNATGHDQHTVWRKYREIVAAAKLSDQLSKDQILERYLNTIYFGRGAYGIQTAAQAYFGVPAQRLTLDQGALLAGLIQAPSRYDPEVDPAAARARWNYVLNGMLAQAWITLDQRHNATFPATVTRTTPDGGIPTDDLGHVYTQVESELAGLGFGEQELTHEGLLITTTIDETRQREAARIAQREMAADPAKLRAALVAEDPRTGALVAYYGGPNGVGLDYARALRQPGSSFKPFVMAAALRQDPPIGLGTLFDGSSPQVIAGQTVANSDGDSCEECDLQTAMTKSINTVFYRLAVQVGPATVATAAADAGIPAGLLTDPTGGIALGDKEVHPGDMASAYATFAAGGLYRRPHLVSKVQAADGQVLYQAPDDPGQQRFTAQVARNVTESMVDVAASSRIPLAGNRPVAAKTGTTQNAVAGQNKDAWTVGYTPTLSTAVWVGTDDNSPIKTSAGRPIYGRMVPGEIWRGFMDAALSGSRALDFGPFEPLGQAVATYGDGTGFGDGYYDGDDDYGDDDHAHHDNGHDDGDSDSDESDSDDAGPDPGAGHHHRQRHDGYLLGDSSEREGG